MYRLLEVGEIICEGDEFWSEDWRLSESIGLSVGEPGTRNLASDGPLAFRRKMTRTDLSPSFSPSYNEDKPGETFSQVLVLEIDTGHNDFDGRQSTAVAAILRNLADHFEKTGVQLTKYPAVEYGSDGKAVCFLDLVEETK